MNKLRQIIREEIKSLLQEDVKDDLERALKSHDWYYERSDARNVYQKGHDSWWNIMGLLPKVDKRTAEGLWKKYAPKGFGFPEGMYDKKVKKKPKHKFQQRFKKGDKVLVDGTGGNENLYSRYQGVITKVKGWEVRKPLNTSYAVYDIKVDKVYSKSQRELNYIGDTVTAFDFQIKEKR